MAVQQSSPDIVNTDLERCAEAQPATLGWQRDLLLHASKQALVGPDASVWPPAAPAACAMALSLSSRCHTRPQTAGLTEQVAELPAQWRSASRVGVPHICSLLGPIGHVLHMPEDCWLPSSDVAGLPVQWCSASRVSAKPSCRLLGCIKRVPDPHADYYWTCTASPHFIRDLPHPAPYARAGRYGRVAA